MTCKGHERTDKAIKQKHTSLNIILRPTSPPPLKKTKKTELTRKPSILWDSNHQYMDFSGNSCLLSYFQNHYIHGQTWQSLQSACQSNNLIIWANLKDNWAPYSNWIRISPWLLYVKIILHQIHQPHMMKYFSIFPQTINWVCGCLVIGFNHCRNRRIHSMNQASIELMSLVHHLKCSDLLRFLHSIWWRIITRQLHDDNIRCHWKQVIWCLCEMNQMIGMIIQYASNDVLAFDNTLCFKWHHMTTTGPIPYYGDKPNYLPMLPAQGRGACHQVMPSDQCSKSSRIPRSRSQPQ